MKGWLVLRYPIEGEEGEDYLATVGRYRHLWWHLGEEQRIAVEWDKTTDPDSAKEGDRG